MAPQNQKHDLPFIMHHHSPMCRLPGIIVVCIALGFGEKLEDGSTKQEGKLFPKPLSEGAH